MYYLLEKDIKAVGTLVSNRKGLPKEFVETAGRKEFSCEILWNADDVRIILHSYVVKAKSTGLRNVLLLSTLEPIIAVTQDGGKQVSRSFKSVKCIISRRGGDRYNWPTSPVLHV